MQETITFRNLEIMLARYLQLKPENLDHLINLTRIATISPFVDIAHVDQLDTEENLLKQKQVADIFRSAGELTAQKMGESWRWYGTAHLTQEFLGILKQNLDELHAHTKSKLGLDPAALLKMFDQARSATATEPAPATEKTPRACTQTHHRACTEAANTVYEHAQRTLDELNHRAKLQQRARADHYAANPGPHTAKLLLDSHIIPEIIAGRGEHFRRCLGCLRHLENVIDRLEKGLPTLQTGVHF